jgi:hypothetical protein
MFFSFYVSCFEWVEIFATSENIMPYSNRVANCGDAGSISGYRKSAPPTASQIRHSARLSGLKWLKRRVDYVVYMVLFALISGSV